MVGPNCERPVRVFCRHLWGRRSGKYLHVVLGSSSSQLSFTGILTCERHICRHQCLHFGRYHVNFFGRIVLILEISQAAQDVAASKDVLAELFERIGYFFTRLETYTKVVPTTAMSDIITEIMVEVLRIFGIATKELRRGSASEFRIGYL